VCKKKAKGVPKRHVDKNIDFEDLKDCLFYRKIIKLGDENALNEKHREK
jgi:hypothetical protein